MLTPLPKLPGHKKRLSGKDLNVFIDRINLLSRVTGYGGTQVIAGPTGIQIRGGSGGVNSTTRIYRVQDTATGDGVYECFEQLVDSTDWLSTTNLIDKVVDKDSVTVEVWNAYENFIYTPYAEALFANDLMVGWQVNDDEGNIRVVGIPAIPTIVRLAFVQENAPHEALIEIKLADNTGTAAGATIEATCIIYGGSFLDEAVPRLTTSSIVFVIQLWGLWYVLSPFITTEDCTCGT